MTATVDALRDTIGVQLLGALLISGPPDAHEVLQEIEGLLTPLLGRHRIVSTRHVDVAPGAALPPTCRPTIHLDAPHSTVELLIALTDASGHGGQVRVPSRRPTVGAWRAPEDEVRLEGGLRTLPLRAGEAVLLDDGVVWCTHPNNTDSITQFLVMTIAPQSAEVVLLRRTNGVLHYSTADDEEVHRALTHLATPDCDWRPLDRIAPPTPQIRRTPRSVLSAAAMPAVDAARHLAREPIQARRDALRWARDRAERAARSNRPLRTSWEGARAMSSARRRGAGAAETIAEMVLGAADATTSVDMEGWPGPSWLAEVVDDSERFAVEMSAIRLEVELPPVSAVTGYEGASDGLGERRWVLADEGVWVDRSVERAPITCDALRRRRDLLGAAFVELSRRSGPQPSIDPHGGVARVLVPLDHSTQQAPTVSVDRRRATAVAPGRYLLIDVQRPGAGWSRAVDGLAMQTRPLHPRSRWTGDRLMAWEAREAADVEPPEGVIVDDYEDFANGAFSFGWFRTREGRRRLLDKASVPAILTLVSLNNRLVSRHLRGTRAVWDPNVFPWVEGVEAAWPEIRDEAVALLESRQWVPTVREVVGVEAEQGRPAVGTGNQWRNFILYHRGQWMDWNCRQCPSTTAVVREIPDLNFAFFSILEPHGHIVRHRGPNRGALRHHLGVLIPDPPGSCTIEINGVLHHWSPGETLMFDLTSEHEVWNHSDQARVLLMCEVNTPLPIGLSGFNRLTQAVYSAMPPFRRMKDHLRSLEPAERSRSATRAM